jgi:GT2 family glycosyltransferase
VSESGSPTVDADVFERGRSIEAEITLVVVTHNSARHIPAFALALSQSSLAPTRSLVVDNASTDDSAARAEAAGFAVCATGSNEGFGAACNLGLNMASTELILFCNPDVRPSPDALERLALTLARNPSAAVAGAAFEDRVEGRRFSRITGDVVGFIPHRLRSRVERFGCQLPVDSSQDQVVVDYAVGAYLLCRVAALRSVGGFDERFFLYSEEEDLCRRLGEAGWQTLLVPSARVIHEGTTSSEGVDKAVMSSFRFHSLYWYYRRYHSRGYAELARCMFAICVMTDRIYRTLVRRRQVYSAGAAVASFRSVAAIRCDHERRSVLAYRHRSRLHGS